MRASWSSGVAALVQRMSWARRSMWRARKSPAGVPQARYPIASWSTTSASVRGWPLTGAASGRNWTSPLIEKESAVIVRLSEVRGRVGEVIALLRWVQQSVCDQGLDVLATLGVNAVPVED